VKRILTLLLLAALLTTGCSDGKKPDEKQVTPVPTQSIPKVPTGSGPPKVPFS